MCLMCRMMCRLIGVRLSNRRWVSPESRSRLDQESRSLRLLVGGTIVRAGPARPNEDARRRPAARARGGAGGARVRGGAIHTMGRNAQKIIHQEGSIT